LDKLTTLASRSSEENQNSSIRYTLLQSIRRKIKLENSKASPF
jgi:hypothetical protein